MANDREFRMVDFQHIESLKDGEVRIIDVEELKSKIWSTSIPHPLKMHGFFSNSYSES
jgi:Ni,Fe-hydrogenase maturation factor